MQATTQNVKLYSLSLREARTYLLAALFIIGNIAVPQLCHMALPKGGLIFLPIYFFTLIGAYKYGARVGLLTAILSPLINSWLFGMPAVAMLPAILIKSVLLAGFAAFVAHKSQRVSLLALLAVVLAYQVVGCGIESLLDGSLAAGLTDFKLGWPGMLVQVLGGYAVLRWLLKK